jgi:hypothetical protein
MQMGPKPEGMNADLGKLRCMGNTPSAAVMRFATGRGLVSGHYGLGAWLLGPWQERRADERPQL